MTERGVVAAWGHMRSLLGGVVWDCTCDARRPRKKRYRGRRTGALAQTMPMFTSGLEGGFVSVVSWLGVGGANSLQPTLVVVAPGFV